MKRTIRTARAYAIALTLAATISMTSCRTQDISEIELAQQNEPVKISAEVRLARVTRAIQTVSDELVEIVNSVLGTNYPTINNETIFTSDLLADEVDMINIFNKIRIQFGFNVPAEDREKIITFGDLVNYVTEHTVSIPSLPSNPNIQIFEKIQEIINEKMDIPISLICVHSNIRNDFGMDSLDFFEFIMELEEEFGIEIPDEYAARIITVEDCWAYIESRC
ncbi:acyl carrier protein [Alistipes senegalensis]|uniref:acyl carrier protein n=1 Tax=Alistipes senegalensis TaxID=1288121 RepID=UPI00266EAB07|nr:acyl carrier protein [Alistipes senegalensis]